MYKIMEIIGRYVLTGIILYGALFFMLVIRLVFVAYKESGSTIREMDKFIEEFEPVDAGGKIKQAIEWILYPYGLVAAVHRYMKNENKAICKFRELNKKETG